MLDHLGSSPVGLTNKEAAARLEELGPNAVRTHRAVVLRDGTTQDVDVTALVPGDGTTQDVDVTALVLGDVLLLSLGAIIPADIRLLSTKNLLCDESILTGESLPAGKAPCMVVHGSALGDL